MYHNGKRKPVPRLTEEEKADFAQLRQIARDAGITADRLAQLLGLANFQTLQVSRSKGRRAKALIELSNGIRQRLLMHDIKK